MQSLIWVGIEFHLSAALTENAVCPNAVFLNVAEQSPLTDALVSLALLLQNDTLSVAQDHELIYTSGTYLQSKENCQKSINYSFE